MSKGYLHGEDRRAIKPEKVELINEKERGIALNFQSFFGRPGCLVKQTMLPRVYFWCMKKTLLKLCGAKRFLAKRLVDRRIAEGKDASLKTVE